MSTTGTNPDELILTNLRLVHTIVRDFRRSLAERDDLQQEGRLGLCRAAQLYDPSFGPFARFARSVIKFHLARLSIAAARPDRAVGGDDLDAIAVEPVDDDRDADVWAAVAVLPPEDQPVIIRLFGLAGEKIGRKKTAAVLGTSEKHVRQIKAKSLRTMRRYLSA